MNLNPGISLIKRKDKALILVETGISTWTKMIKSYKNKLLQKEWN